VTLYCEVNGKKQNVRLPSAGELPDAARQIETSVKKACGNAAPHPFLSSRIMDALLNALVEQSDWDIGEVLAKPARREPFKPKPK
jgi:hypothetical protein